MDVSLISAWRFLMTDKSKSTKDDRPKVYLDGVGRRYVKAEELFQRPSTRERIRKLAELEDQILTKGASGSSS